MEASGKASTAALIVLCTSPEDDEPPPLAGSWPAASERRALSALVMASRFAALTAQGGTKASPAPSVRTPIAPGSVVVSVAATETSSPRLGSCSHCVSRRGLSLTASGTNTASLQPELG